MRNKMLKRMLCGLLACVLVLGYIPVPAHAAETDGLCAHHTQHTPECGYSTDTAGSPCTHVCTESCYQTVTQCVHVHGDCGYVPAVLGQGCGCLPDENGIVNHVEGCGYVEPTAEVPCGHACSAESGCVVVVSNCQHVHDASCGYVEGAAESPCTYQCAECQQAAADQAAADAVAALIAELPTVEELRAMTAEEQQAVYSRLQAALSAYNALTGAQKALIPEAETVLLPLLEYFDSLGNGDGQETGSDAPAEDPEAPVILTWGEYSYTLLSDGSVSVCGFEGVPQDGKPFFMEVPDEINDAWVTEIAESAFAGNTKIEAVLLPKTVAAIGSGAFEGCENLRLLAICGESVSFGDTLARGAYSLEAIYVRHTQALYPILELLEHDFGPENSIALQSYETVASLEEAFAAQNQPELEESGSIEDDTGTQTGNGNAMYTTGENGGAEDDTVVARGTCGDNLTWTLEDNVLTISGFGEMYNYYWNTVPWHEYVSEIVAVELLGEITNIGDNAFNNAKNITSIDLPTTLTRIGDFAFEGCTGITEIEIPNSVTYIGDYSFRGVNLTEITIPESIVSVGDRAFDECSLLEIVYLNAADAKVGSQIFPDSCQSSKDISLIVGRSVKKIPDDLFSSNSSCTALLTNVFFEEDSQCIEIGAGAFDDCIKLENITLPNKLKTIGAYAFSCCSLQSITLPDTITEIGECAFNNNSQLAIVNIPPNVSTIGKYAFMNCTAIEEIRFNATEMNSLLYDHQVFYCAGDQEKGITVTIGKDVTKIPAYLFHNHTNIIRVVFEKDSVCETIGESAFEGC